MKKILFLIIIIFSTMSIFSQCDMFYQKSNGHFAFDEDCAIKIKQQNGFTTAQMKKLITKSLKDVEKISKAQVKAYGRAKMAEAEKYRRKKEAENKIRLIVTSYKNEIKQEQSYSKPNVSKRKTNKKYQVPNKSNNACNHSSSWHKKNGSCASPQ